MYTHIIKNNNFTFDDSNIRGLIKLTQQSNSGTNITLGSACAAELTFEVDDQAMQYRDIAGQEFVYKVEESSPYTFGDGSVLTFRDGSVYYFLDDVKTFGYFIAERPERINDTRWKITMYDRMKRFDKPADGFSVKGKTIGAILAGLCAFCGVPYAAAAIPNSGYVVGEDISGENITCRDILKWIGEAACRYAIMGEDGALRLKWYAQTAKVISNANTFSLKVTDYETAPIDKVQVKSTENDIGVIIGTGTNCYVIAGNPLLYAVSDAVLRPAVQAIYNAINGFRYTPVEAVVLHGDVDVRIGDRIKVNSFRERDLSTIVMSTVRTPLKTELKSTGDKELTTVKAVNRVVKQAAGKTAELIHTVDKFAVVMTQMQDDIVKTQTSVTVQADRITAEVKARTDANTELSSKITQNADSITAEVTNRTNEDKAMQSSIKQNAEAIVLKVSTEDYNGDTIASKINQTATTIQIQAAKIDMRGDLDLRGVFRSYEGSNQSLIEAGQLAFKYGSGYTGSITTNYVLNGVRYLFLQGGTGNVGIAAKAGSMSHYIAMVSKVALQSYVTGSGTNLGHVYDSVTGQSVIGLVSSSRRYKHDIRYLESEHGIDVIRALMPCGFRYNQTEQECVGFIAEDVEQVSKLLVNYAPDGQVESNRDSGIIAMCVLALQNIDRRLKEIENHST